jgi:hypothetical protein
MKVPDRIFITPNENITWGTYGTHKIEETDIPYIREQEPTFNHVPFFVSESCIGEFCSVCKKKATNKLGEEIANDDPNKNRHNLTAYVCREHFEMIFGGKNPQNAGWQDFPVVT